MMIKIVSVLHNILLCVVIIYVIGVTAKIVSIFFLSDTMDAGLFSAAIANQTYLLGCVSVIAIPTILINIAHKLFTKRFIKPTKIFYWITACLVAIVLFSAYAENSAHRIQYSMGIKFK